MPKPWMLFWLGLFLGFSWANELQDKLMGDLNRDAGANYSIAELAFIAEGAADTAELESWVQRYQAILSELKLTDKQASQPDRKRIKQLAKLWSNRVKVEENAEPGLRPLLETGTVDSLTNALVFLDLCRQRGLEDDLAIKALQGPETAYFNDISSPHDLMAMVWTKRALFLPNEKAAAMEKLLRLSALLVPEMSLGQGDWDVRLYQRAERLYQAGSWPAAAQIAVGAATRYPRLEAFHPLCFNIGIKLMDAAQNPSSRLAAGEWGRLLAPHTGPNRETFENALATNAYNVAVDLYNAGDFSAAVNALEIQDLNAGNQAKLLANAYERLIEEFAAEGNRTEAQNYFAKLENLAPERVPAARKVLDQWALKALDDSGDLAQALDLAAKNLEDEPGRQNYFSVLVRHTRALLQQKQFENVLTLLSRTPDTVRASDTVRDLRFNAYAAWLKHFPDENYAQLIPIYQRALADERLQLKDKDRAAFMENYASALYREIDDLIAERQFHKADQKSKQALALAPDHPALKAQRQKIDTILERIEP